MAVDTQQMSKDTAINGSENITQRVRKQSTWPPIDLLRNMSHHITLAEGLHICAEWRNPRMRMYQIVRMQTFQRRLPTMPHGMPAL